MDIPGIGSGASSGGGALPYLGPVATRPFFPTEKNTSFKQSMTETYHPLMDDVSFVVLVYYNGYVNSGNEIALGGTTTYTASVENPTLAPGVRNQAIMCSAISPSGAPIAGATQGTAADNSLIYAVVPVKGFAGQEIIARVYTNSATGLVFTSYAIDPRDKMAYGASGVVDQTLSGTVISGAGSNAVRPVAILGMTAKPTAFLAGDSIGFGYVDNAVTDWWGNIGLVARPLGKTFGYIHGEIPSARLSADVTASYRIRQQLAQYPSHVISQGGINDINGGTSAASLAALRAQFAAKFPGKIVIGTTLIPNATSTDNFTTLANQSVASAANENARVAFNTLVRKGISGEKGYFDFDDALSSDRNSGKWAVGLTPGATTGAALTGDGLHPNALGGERASRFVTPRPVELLRR